MLGAKNDASGDIPNGAFGRLRGRPGEEANRVSLAPDVADVFPDSKSVNEALRLLIRMSREYAGAKSKRP